MVQLSDVVDLLHGWYPPATADSWDAVGLVYGDLTSDVGKVMFAVDPTLGVAREAVAWGADLLVVHHPLFLRPVHGFTTATPKGRTLTTLARGGCALLTAHTNADQAAGGVSEALASALGLTELAPLRPAPAVPLDKTAAMLNLDMIGRPGGHSTVTSCSVTPAACRTKKPDAGSGPNMPACGYSPSSSGTGPVGGGAAGAVVMCTSSNVMPSTG